MKSASVSIMQKFSFHTPHVIGAPSKGSKQ